MVKNAVVPMDIQTKENLDLIKESILANVQAESIYLFGSYANGTPNKDSDFDIYVVVPDDTKDMLKSETEKYLCKTAKNYGVKKIYIFWC